MLEIKIKINDKSKREINTIENLETWLLTVSLMLVKYNGIRIQVKWQGKFTVHISPSYQLKNNLNSYSEPFHITFFQSYRKDQ